MDDYSLEFQNINGLQILTSPKLLRERSIFIAYATRQHGVSPHPFDSLNCAYHVGDEPANVKLNRTILTQALSLDMSRLVGAEQVHGNSVRVATEDDAGSGAFSQESALEDTDGTVTSVKNMPMMILTADCLPVALVDKTGQVVGAVHAGSEGVYLEIVPRALQLMGSSFGVKPEGVAAFIGPGIRSCCYEVSDERARDFSGKFGAEFISHKICLDLPGVVRKQLLEAGIGEADIHDSNLCTCCRDDLFFSYRRDGTCGRQAMIVVRMVDGE